MQKHRKMIILALLLALVLTGCSHAKRQEASNTSNSSAQEEPPIVLETVPELSDASESALEAVEADAAHEAVVKRVESVCEHILDNTAVFKRDQNGRAAFLKFLSVCGFSVR